MFVAYHASCHATRTLNIGRAFATCRRHADTSWLLAITSGRQYIVGLHVSTMAFHMLAPRIRQVIRRIHYYADYAAMTLFAYAFALLMLIRRKYAIAALICRRHYT